MLTAFSLGTGLAQVRRPGGAYRAPAYRQQPRAAMNRPAPSRSAPAAIQPRIQAQTRIQAQSQPQVQGRQFQPQLQSQAQPHQPAPIERVQPQSEPRFAQSEARPNTNTTPVRPAPQTGAGSQLVVPNRPGQTQQHLGPWMQAHSNLPLAEQQRALDNEPNFRSLPPQEQQQLHQQLTRLNAMPHEQRDKVIERTESMERLQPRQRQQVRDAMGQLGGLPEDRRAAVARAFHQALAMPEGQRQQWLNSPQVHSQYNDNERDTINHLLVIQPAAAQAGFSWAKPQAAAGQTPRD